MKIKRGQIYLADLSKGYGSEQGGIRPVLVIQNNKGNKYSPTLIIACITSRYQYKHHLPTHYYIPDSAGLKHRSIVMMEQIKVIDKTRLIKYIGSVSPKFMNILDKKIMISLGMNYKYTKVNKHKREHK
ncbi:endoribonuclease EndoA [Thomasclavelia cocleata]|uniref:mRNA interferase n=1 Tax=Thomasclavelia cocleata TaxID=69824 RepID=A0A829ZED2_9FIRM|nr:type II toxin-antitoxin system PemK/MazF family toxin [Thomasclavelia cocleata]GFI42327.1 endoribonuclease EndoA [Thomasclavelia cocleata]